MSPCKFAVSIPRRRWTCLNWLVVQMSLDIARQSVGRLVSATSVLLQSFHHDPIQLPADQLRQCGRRGVPKGSDACRGFGGANPRTGPLRLVLANNSTNFVEGRQLELLLADRRGTGDARPAALILRLLHKRNRDRSFSPRPIDASGHRRKLNLWRGVSGTSF